MANLMVFYPVHVQNLNRSKSLCIRNQCLSNLTVQKLIQTKAEWSAVSAEYHKHIFETNVLLSCVDNYRLFLLFLIRFRLRSFTKRTQASESHFIRINLRWRWKEDTKHCLYGVLETQGKRIHDRYTWGPPGLFVPHVLRSPKGLCHFLHRQHSTSWVCGCSDLSSKMKILGHIPKNRNTNCSAMWLVDHYYHGV